MENKYFNNLGILSSGILCLSPNEAYSICLKNAVLIDVREKYLTGYKKFDVPNVLFLPASEINDWIKKLKKDIPYIIADSTGIHSMRVIKILISEGFENIANLAGGIVEWEHQKLPLIIDNSERLDGSCVCQLRPRHKK